MSYRISKGKPTLRARRALWVKLRCHPDTLRLRLFYFLAVAYLTMMDWPVGSFGEMLSDLKLAQATNTRAALSAKQYFLLLAPLCYCSTSGTLEKFIPMFLRGAQLVFHMGLQISLPRVGHWAPSGGCCPGSCSKAPRPSRRPDTWLLSLAATEAMATTQGTAALGAPCLMAGCVCPAGAIIVGLPMGLLPTAAVALVLVRGWVLPPLVGQPPPESGYKG